MVTLNFGTVMLITLAITIGTLVGKLICNLLDAIAELFLRQLSRKVDGFTDFLAEALNGSDVIKQNKKKEIGFICKDDKITK